ncbi:hypothetical protein SAMN02910456_01396 [Ruminococcaceae bacterium YRB3002]|nr:hypothetical protein SAMN02910456_01396 [Ruminococcaceae bacterium YRB3002]
MKSKIGNLFRVFYVLAAVAIIVGTFLPFVEMHYGYDVAPTTLFSGILGKVICGVAALAALLMIIKYTRVLTFLTTAITDGCAIVCWANWKDQLVDTAPVQALTAVYTRGYGYFIFMAGAIMLLVFGILCFLFVDED